MKILICKTFGLGNAIQSVPMIKAIRLANPTAEIHVLVGSTADDIGAYDVLIHLETAKVIDRLYTGLSFSMERDRKYDAAVLSIPYDGRWRNGEHFHADRVFDGRTRPDPKTVGLVSWQKHEVEYQMENAYALGYEEGCGIPSCSFLLETEPRVVDQNLFYVGVGYKKDEAGFWKIKHWGNENFANLIKLILTSSPNNRVLSTGDVGDLQHSLTPIYRMVADPRYEIKMVDMQQSFALAQRCCAYIGNDTGFMHVFASLNRPTWGIFRMGPQSIVKSSPWCWPGRALEDRSDDPITPERVAEECWMIPK